MNRMTRLMAAFTLIACGGSPSNANSNEPATEEAQSGSETPTWSAMNDGQRFAFMQQTVMPEMARLFREFDGERFAETDCTLCHGANAREVHFEMPNGIAPLNPEHVPQMFGSDQPMAVFMTQTVWPRMTELLDREPYNPETNEGFGCFGCHGMAAEAPVAALP